MPRLFASVLSESIFETRGWAGHRNVRFNNAKINLCRKEEAMSPSRDAFQASVSRLTRKRLGKGGREQTATPWKRAPHGPDRCGYSEKTQSRPHQGANAEPLTAARRSRARARCWEDRTGALRTQAPGAGLGTRRVRLRSEVWRCIWGFTHRTRRSGRRQGSRERRPRSGSLRGTGTKRCSLGSGKLLLPPWAPGVRPEQGCVSHTHVHARTRAGAAQPRCVLGKELSKLQH